MNAVSLQDNASAILDDIEAIDLGTAFCLRPNMDSQMFVVTTLPGAEVPELTHHRDHDLMIDDQPWVRLDEHTFQWSAWPNRSNQHGYPGPILHPSETFSVCWVADMIEQARKVSMIGSLLFAAVPVETEDPDHPAGWALLSRYQPR